MKVFIYSWDYELVNSWPYNYTHDKLSFLPNHANNFGIGNLINRQQGLFNTHQYSLFTTFYHRLLESNIVTITKDSSDADLFFIPYDIGMDSTTRQSDGALQRTNCPKVDAITQLIKSSEAFIRSNGSDHFLIHSINQPMTYFMNSKCMKFYRLCYHCIKLSIDTYMRGTFSQLDSNSHMTHNWFSIPFPSSYHMNLQAVAVPWINIERSSRPFIVIYMGTSKVTARKQQKLRNLLRDECISRISTCLYVSLDSHESIANLSFTNNQLIYTKGIFCLMPGGDFPTRKGILDALLSGCIPVTFQESSAQFQWKFHWGSKAYADNCTLYFPRRVAYSNISQIFDKILDLANNDEYLMETYKCIRSVGTRMQYNVPYGFRNYKNPPIDAVDIIMKELSHIIKLSNKSY